MNPDPNDTDAVLTGEEDKVGSVPPRPPAHDDRLDTEPDGGRIATTPEQGRKPASQDERTMLVGRDAIAAMEARIAVERSPDGEQPVRVDRDLIAEMQAELDRGRLHRAETLPLPGPARSDDPTPIKGLRRPPGIAPALTVLPISHAATQPQSQGLNAVADVAAAAGATAAVAAGITAGAFAAGTFGWADPLVAAVLGAVALAVVYLTARSLFASMMRGR